MRSLLQVWLGVLVGGAGLFYAIDYALGGILLTPRGATVNVFERCVLEDAVMWTDELRSFIDPTDDPMKYCDRSWRPWSELLPSGVINLTHAWEADADCRARAVLFKNEKEVSLGEWHAISEHHVFEQDFVEVECLRAGVSFYHFLHSQIWRNQKPSEQPEEGAARGSQPSVYILLLDSMGAAHSRRVFNRTHRFLKEAFDAVEMHHLNKVGENSLPNGHAFLFDRRVMAVDRGVYGLPSLPADMDPAQYCRKYLDARGHILQQFAKAGYTTMAAEDQGVFDYPDCLAFKAPPTHHYWRPFIVRYKGGPGLLRQTQGGSRCYESHLFIQDYLQQFIRAYPDAPKASIAWFADLGHDYMNLPFHADPHFHDFLERHREELDNSYVFFMADHGQRLVPQYVSTPSGRGDINNPQLFLSVPRRLRNATGLLENLRANSRKLLTQYDVYATLVDILEMANGTQPMPDFTERLERPHLKGSSMLRPLPPGTRNCMTLPIPPQYCICKTARDSITISSAHDGIGRAVAQAANAKLAATNVSDICAELEFDKLLSLNSIRDSDNLYDVVALLRPSGGHFGTLVRDVGGGVYNVVVPDVTRLNKYGSQADCTSINDIRPLCYCRSQGTAAPEQTTQKSG